MDDAQYKEEEETSDYFSEGLKWSLSASGISEDSLSHAGQDTRKGACSRGEEEGKDTMCVSCRAAKQSQVDDEVADIEPDSLTNWNGNGETESINIAPCDTEVHGRNCQPILEPLILAEMHGSVDSLNTQTPQAVQNWMVNEALNTQGLPETPTSRGNESWNPHRVPDTLAVSECDKHNGNQITSPSDEILEQVSPAVILDSPEWTSEATTTTTTTTTTHEQPETSPMTDEQPLLSTSTSAHSVVLHEYDAIEPQDRHQQAAAQRDCGSAQNMNTADDANLVSYELLEGNEDDEFNDVVATPLADAARFTLALAEIFTIMPDVLGEEATVEEAEGDKLAEALTEESDFTALTESGEGVPEIGAGSLPEEGASAFPEVTSLPDDALVVEDVELHASVPAEEPTVLPEATEVADLVVLDCVGTRDASTLPKVTSESEMVDSFLLDVAVTEASSSLPKDVSDSAMEEDLILLDSIADGDTSAPPIEVLAGEDSALQDLTSSLLLDDSLLMEGSLTAPEDASALVLPEEAAVLSEVTPEEELPALIPNTLAAGESVLQEPSALEKLVFSQEVTRLEGAAALEVPNEASLSSEKPSALQVADSPQLQQVQEELEVLTRHTATEPSHEMISDMHEKDLESLESNLILLELSSDLMEVAATSALPVKALETKVELLPIEALDKAVVAAVAFPTEASDKVTYATTSLPARTHTEIDASLLPDNSDEILTVTIITETSEEVDQRTPSEPPDAKSEKMDTSPSDVDSKETVLESDIPQEDSSPVKPKYYFIDAASLLEEEVPLPCSTAPKKEAESKPEDKSETLAREHPHVCSECGNPLAGKMEEENEERRRENERRQGELLFRSSIQQFSQHSLEGSATAKPEPDQKTPPLAGASKSEKHPGSFAYILNPSLMQMEPEVDTPTVAKGSPSPADSLNEGDDGAGAATDKPEAKKDAHDSRIPLVSAALQAVEFKDQPAVEPAPLAVGYFLEMTKSKREEETETQEHKSMFSMFIDFSDIPTKPRREFRAEHVRSRSISNPPVREPESEKEKPPADPLPQTRIPKPVKDSVFMFIEADAPRRPHRSMRPRVLSQSWVEERKERGHKRAQSFGTPGEAPERHASPLPRRSRLLRMVKSEELAPGDAGCTPKNTPLMARKAAAQVEERSPMCLTPRKLHDDEIDATLSEASEISSMQSSMERSGAEATTTTETDSSDCKGRNPCSRLGEDLLRMFLEEVNTDIVVEVGGHRIRAHKCILSSRCQYFAAMLSGGWVESAGNIISLQGFSYNAVHFALCHIYSGASDIPNTINIVELATLADMLGLEGLKEVISYTLKVKYCHFFHKPCSVCVVGVLECLPLAAAYGLDEIYRKSLRWVTKYFTRIWPTKAFASLPCELIEKCYQQNVLHLSADNVMDTVLSCDKLLATLPSVRWAEPVFGITTRLLEASIKFMAKNFSTLLTSEKFLALGRGLSWNISQLEDTILTAVGCMSPNEACQSHVALYRLLRNMESDASSDLSPNFVDFLRKIGEHLECHLVKNANRVVQCQSWESLEEGMQRKLTETVFLMLKSDKQQPVQQQTRLASLNRKPVGSSGYSSGASSGAAPQSLFCTTPRPTRRHTTAIATRRTHMTDPLEDQPTDVCASPLVKRAAAVLRAQNKSSPVPIRSNIADRPTSVPAKAAPTRLFTHQRTGSTGSSDRLFSPRRVQKTDSPVAPEKSSPLRRRKPSVGTTQSPGVKDAAKPKGQVKARSPLTATSRIPTNKQPTPRSPQATPSKAKAAPPRWKAASARDVSGTSSGSPAGVRPRTASLGHSRGASNDSAAAKGRTPVKAATEKARVLGSSQATQASNRPARMQVVEKFQRPLSPKVTNSAAGDRKFSSPARRAPTGGSKPVAIVAPKTTRSYRDMAQGRGGPGSPRATPRSRAGTMSSHQPAERTDNKPEVKFLAESSRSGTFLKDEPTVIKKPENEEEMQ